MTDIFRNQELYSLNQQTLTALPVMKQTPCAQRCARSALRHRGSLLLKGKFWRLFCRGNNAHRGRNSHLCPGLLPSTASEQKQNRQAEWAQVTGTQAVPKPPDITCGHELKFRSGGCQEKRGPQLCAVAMPAPCPSSCSWMVPLNAGPGEPLGHSVAAALCHQGVSRQMAPGVQMLQELPQDHSDQPRTEK